MALIQNIMKTLFTFLACMFFSISNAQIINIPDANFKNKLLSSSTSNPIARDINYNGITIDTNGNNEIEQSEALQVYYLYVYSSNISSLTGIQYFSNLIALSCVNNLLTTLDISNLNYLEDLACGNNLLSALNLNSTSIKNLSFAHNNLVNFDASNLPSLQDLRAGNNQLTSLDLSNCYDLTYVDCISNNLQYVNIKNGNPNNPENFAADSYTYYNNPNLQFICVNDNFVSIIQMIINSTQGIPNNVVVSSYCSFTPGGTYYTLQGSNKYDGGNNGCETTDPIIPNMKFSITNNGTQSGYFIANASGNYNIPVSAGTHTITPVLEYPSYFNITPTSSTVSFPATSSPYLQNFCVTANGIKHDLEIITIPTSDARPGYDATYEIIYKNKGNQTENGTITFNFDDTILDLVSTTPVLNNQQTNILTWNYNNLLPFETRTIKITLNVNSHQETPPVNTGDILNLSATINPVSGDELPTDNTSTLNQEVVSSYDPNDKTCVQGSIINPNQIGEYLHYIIRFENTGNYQAENVVVKDIIDNTKYDINSLQVIKTSHQAITKITDNKVEFIFEDINLPFQDTFNDGFVVFKIKTKPTLSIGTSVSNTASIYFDYNYPINTNTETSTFQTLSNTPFLKNEIMIYPNPSTGIFTINFNEEIEAASILVFNILGKVVYNQSLNPEIQNQIDLTHLANGYYMAHITNKGMVSQHKLIKN
jgi:uncharacterized repeat protein (TIGR01451 family)